MSLPSSARASAARPDVDIVIPVYKNLELTRACIESVLASDLPEATGIVVIDDASPQSEVSAYCRSLADAGLIHLITHAQNQGFVVSVNAGMAVSPMRDVVLLNSDTRVANNWLQRLQLAAYSEERIASVTPFSNNASICSYPEICASNSLPAALSLEELDNLCAKANAGATAELPTAVGFCMFIRRACLNQIGNFDALRFGRGYGEENEFCLRARTAGWRHLLAADVFVFHEGSASFGTERFGLMHRAEGLIAEQYPKYVREVREFIARDPLAILRQKLTRILMAKALEEFTAGELPRLLFITHAWGGGVEQHIQDLLAGLQGRAQVMILRGQSKGRLEVQLAGMSRVWPSWHPGGFDSDYEAWVSALADLGFVRIHLHHVHGWSPRILDLIQHLALPLDVTLHDYYTLSPRYHLSPLDEAAVYEAQSNDADAWPSDALAWQSLFAPLLAKAERVIAPSEDVARRVAAVFTLPQLRVERHPERVMAFPKLTKVALLGGLSQAKGLDLVRRVVAEARRRGLSVCFRLLGHSADVLPEGITATGSYEPEDLGYLISAERPDVIWLASQVHETFGFTLSAALASGKPIVATAVGAFVERLTGQSQAQLLPVNASEGEWLDALVNQAQSTQIPAPYTPRSLADYQHFYSQPLAQMTQLFGHTAALVEVLSSAPAALPEPAVPLKSLLRIGAYGGHKASLEEVERCLAHLPDDEVAVAPWREFAQQADELDKTRDGLAQYRVTLAESQTLLANTQDGLRQYQETLAVTQHQLGDAVDGLRQYRLANEILEQERDLARQQIAALLNSTSWKITRPLRFAARLLRASPSLGRRFLGIVRRPSSWVRILKLLRRGGPGALVERLQQELASGRNSQSPRPADRVETHLLHQQASSTPRVLEPLHLATSEQPRVSILIPVYGQHETTYNCLASIAANPPALPYEVIVADDASPEPAAEALGMVTGIRIVRHPHNLGFLGNVNQGLASAVGEWLILLNNDTLICRDALDALLRTFEEHDSVGLVGAKLLNRDGSVQEAGGIIWRDGSGWNWGRNQHRDDPRFNYVRDADYCSGAVLALRRELFAELGGFDVHYAPAYYEDTDLAFRVRERGLRVVYQPAAEVYHLEGVSHGTDTNSGVKAYQTVNAKKFFERWQSALAKHRDNADQPELEAHRGTRGNILVVEACMITPDQDSGSIRMLNLLALLKREGYHVSFVADNLEYQQRYVEQLQQVGIEVYFGQWAGGGVHKLLKQLGQHLDAIIFCRHYIASEYLPDVRKLAPRARIIFDTVDLHFVREEREAKLHNNSAMLRASTTTRVQELGLIAACDVTLVVSEFEKNLLAQLVPEARVEIVSNIHSHNPERPGYAAREGIIFVGGFRHPPNTDAISWYAQEVLPRLRQLLPGIKTRVIGSNMPESVRSLASADLEILGFVENIDPYLQLAKVSIAPLRYGAGVKGKVNEAMNYGIPVVATACAVEGMHLSPGEEVLVADDAQGFAEAIVRVYRDEQLWQQLSRAGVENVRRHFSPEAALPAVQRMLQE